VSLLQKKEQKCKMHPNIHKKLETLFLESAKQPKQVLKMEVAVLKKLQGNASKSQQRCAASKTTQKLADLCIVNAG
jgi:hypothetical protein